MRLDNNGYICVSGASDSEDSSMFVGMLATFDSSINIDFTKYINAEGKYQRCLNPRYDFSRDQYIPFIAGLKSRGLSHLVSQDRVTGRDLISPSVKGHERRCAGLSANWFQDLWLKAEILYHAKVVPLNEPNQLISMLMIHPNKNLLKMWTTLNKQWKESILVYWSEGAGAWRGEPELAKSMINKILTLIQD